MSSRRIALGAIALLGTGGATFALARASTDRPPAAATRASSTSVIARVPGDLTLGVAQEASGDLLATTIDFSTEGRGSAALTRVPIAGGLPKTTPIVRRPVSAARVSNVLSAVSPAGAVAATSSRSGGPASRSTLRVTTVRPEGSRASDQRVPGLARTARPFALAIGPSGAVGLISVTPARGDGAPTARFSFRAAGAKRFVAPVTLPGAALPSPDGTGNSDLPGSLLQVVMAPDGGATIVDGLHASLRRVAPDGAVGDEHRLDDLGADATTAAFRDDGTLVAASTRSIESKTKTIDDQYYSSQISIAEWPPGSPAPSVRALPLRPGDVAAFNDFSLTLGPAGRTLLAIADGSRHLAVLSGTGTAIEPIARVNASVAYDARAFATADGGTTLLWARDVSGGGGKPLVNTALLTTTAAPGATFGPIQTLRTARQGSVQIKATLQLADDRLAIAYDAAGGDTRLLVTGP